MSAPYPPLPDTAGVLHALFHLFAERGSTAYLGERVSQAEHALQSAWLAEQAGAPSALIAAALLHDLGHLLDPDAADPATSAADLAHEQTGAHWLEAHFGADVCRPVQLHVAAKRYLCSVDGDYFAELSPPSVVSLRLQGGPMSAAEVEQFRRDPFAEQAVALRRWDEQAKVFGLATPPLEYFRPHLEAALRWAPC